MREKRTISVANIIECNCYYNGERTRDSNARQPTKTRRRYLEVIILKMKIEKKNTENHHIQIRST